MWKATCVYTYTCQIPNLPVRSPVCLPDPQYTCQIPHSVSLSAVRNYIFPCMLCEIYISLACCVRNLYIPCCVNFINPLACCANFMYPLACCVKSIHSFACCAKSICCLYSPGHVGKNYIYSLACCANSIYSLTCFVNSVYSLACCAKSI